MGARQFQPAVPMAVEVWQKQPMVICMQRKTAMCIKIQATAGINIMVVDPGLPLAGRRTNRLLQKWAVQPLMMKYKVRPRIAPEVTPIREVGVEADLEVVVVVVVVLAAAVVAGAVAVAGAAAVAVAVASEDVVVAVLAAGDKIFIKTNRIFLNCCSGLRDLKHPKDSW